MSGRDRRRGFSSIDDWTPSQIFGASDPGDWWSAARGFSLWTTSGATTHAGNTDSVGRWDGQKNGHNLSIASNRPTRNLSGSIWAVTFNGTSNSLAVSFTLAQPITRIAAFKQISWTDTDHIFDGATINSCALAQRTSSPTLQIYAGAGGVNNGTMAVGTAAVVTEIFNGASSKIAVNNGAYVSGNAGTTAAGGLTVGSAGDGTLPANVAVSFVFVIGGRSLSTAEIAAVRRFAGREIGVGL